MAFFLCCHEIAMNHKINEVIGIPSAASNQLNLHL